MLCENIGDKKIGTVTMIKLFHGPATKPNFKVYCDECTTITERGVASSDTQRINMLETELRGMSKKLEKFDEVQDQLEELKLLMEKLLTKETPQEPPAPHQPLASVNSIWNDKEKMENVKAQRAVLVVKSSGDEEKCKENQQVVEATIMDNNIPVIESHKNKSGDLVVHFENEEIRDEVRDLVSSTGIVPEIIMTTPTEARPSITIVGLPREYKKEEIVHMVTMQNANIKNFADSNNIDDHFQVHAVRPCKNNPSCFQVFASVSFILREGLRANKDKVTCGMISCKVYDRYHVKKCNNCQKFGHYVLECPTKSVPNCGKCSGNHPTRDCEELHQQKCINCIRNNIDEYFHTTNSHKCPCLIKEQEVLKKKIGEQHLNFMRRAAMKVT